MERQAPPNVLRPVLRLLLLLGAVAVFWLLSTATAQADDGPATGTTTEETVPPESAEGPGQDSPPTSRPDHDPQSGAIAGPRQTEPPASATGGQISDVTAPATGGVRAVPGAVDRSLETGTAAAPASVRIVGQDVTAALEPTLVAVTTSVADTTRHTVRTAEAVVTHAAPTMSTDPAPMATVPGFSSVPTPARPVPAKISATGPVDAIAFIVPDADPAPVTSTRTDVDRPLPANPDPTSDAPMAPAGSGSAWSGVAAAVLGLLLLQPVTHRRRRPRDGDHVPTGPAYPPGTSPG